MICLFGVVVVLFISAVVNVFPPLYEIGHNMSTNFLLWGERRKGEFMADTTLSPETQVEEVKKLDDRMNKFRDKMAFLNELRVMTRRVSSNVGVGGSSGGAVTSSTKPGTVRRASIRPVPV